MKTSETIKKIEGIKQIKRIEVYSLLIWRAKMSENKSMLEEYKCKLRGYLTALQEMEIISETEKAQAYLYYINKDYSKN